MNQEESGKRDGRQPALDICRGVARLLMVHGMAVVAEVTLASGRRADLVGVAASGEIWIVEVKSSLADFRADLKWPEYRDFCDRLFFGVASTFPSDVLPSEAGLIIADRFGGEIIRAAAEHKLPGARRKAMTLRILRASAFRLQATIDPDGSYGDL